MRIKDHFEVNILFLTYYALKKFKILNIMRYKNQTDIYAENYTFKTTFNIIIDF